MAKGSNSYENADILNAVRNLRIYVNTLDNARTQLNKATPIIKAEWHNKIQKLESDMIKLTQKLNIVLSDLETCDEYKFIVKQLKGA